MKNMSANSVLMDYLRIYVLIWQKIDFIWGMFLTTYIPLVGFLHFYRDDISLTFALIAVTGNAGFTLINGNALLSHYRLANSMSREFRSLNRDFPILNDALARAATDRLPKVVFATHSLAFFGFLYLLAQRIMGNSCDAGQGFTCLFQGG